MPCRGCAGRPPPTGEGLADPKASARRRIQADVRESTPCAYSECPKSAPRALRVPPVRSRRHYGQQALCNRQRTPLLRHARTLRHVTRAHGRHCTAYAAALHAARFLTRAACCIGAAWRMRHVACCAARHMLHVARYMLHVARHMSLVARYMSLVARHMSLVARYYVASCVLRRYAMCKKALQHDERLGVSDDPADPCGVRALTRYRYSLESAMQHPCNIHARPPSSLACNSNRRRASCGMQHTSCNRQHTT